jgi:hypothetical protein
MADDPFAFESFLRAIAAEYERAAKVEPRRFLPIGEAAACVLGRITGEEAPQRPAPLLRSAAARVPVPQRRSK